MVVGIFTNLDRDNGLTTTKELIKILRKNKIDYLLHEKMRYFFDERDYFNFDQVGKIDVVISVGGDGTVLGLVDYCVRSGAPIVGVNKGRLGFLNEVEPENLDEIADILRGKHVEDKRSLLEITIEGKKYYALNEALIYRSNEAKTIILDIRVEGQLVDRYCCDGFIVSTPTGSTAYSLSAGGPILSPIAKANVLIPINSHSLRSKPIVVCSKEKVSLSICERSMSGKLMLDGNGVYTVKSGESVVVSGSDACVIFWRKADDYYSKLFYKLNILGTTENL